jgi:V/A-type H+-transporting ATPase subunit B
MHKAFQPIYSQIKRINKATCVLKSKRAGMEEMAIVDGRLAQVVKIIGDEVTLQVFSGTDGISTNAEVIFTGAPPALKVSEDLVGRFFNPFGKPIDKGPDVEGREVSIGGPSVNPTKRKQPSQLISTGIAGIDLNNTLVTGQKIPFFADPEQPYNQIMADVALRAEADKIILGGIGLTNDDYLFYRHVFENAGALDRIVSFINTTEDPSVERLLVPDMALTAA